MLGSQNPIMYQKVSVKRVGGGGWVFELLLYSPLNWNQQTFMQSSGLLSAGVVRLLGKSES